MAKGANSNSTQRNNTLQHNRIQHNRNYTLYNKLQRIRRAYSGTFESTDKGTGVIEDVINTLTIGGGHSSWPERATHTQYILNTYNGAMRRDKTLRTAVHDILGVTQQYAKARKVGGRKNLDVVGTISAAYNTIDSFFTREPVQPKPARPAEAIALAATGTYGNSPRDISPRGASRGSEGNDAPGAQEVPIPRVSIAPAAPAAPPVPAAPVPAPAPQPAAPPASTAQDAPPAAPQSPAQAAHAVPSEVDVLEVTLAQEALGAPEALPAEAPPAPGYENVAEAAAGAPDGKGSAGGTPPNPNYNETRTSMLGNEPPELPAGSYEGSAEGDNNLASFIDNANAYLQKPVSEVAADVRAGLTRWYNSTRTALSGWRGLRAYIANNRRAGLAAGGVAAVALALAGGSIVSHADRLSDEKEREAIYARVRADNEKREAAHQNALEAATSKASDARARADAAQENADNANRHATALLASLDSARKEAGERIGSLEGRLSDAVAAVNEKEAGITSLNAELAAEAQKNAEQGALLDAMRKQEADESARNAFAQTPEGVAQASLEQSLLRGSISRSERGLVPDALEEAVALVRKAEQEIAVAQNPVRGTVALDNEHGLAPEAVFARAEQHLNDAEKALGGLNSEPGTSGTNYRAVDSDMRDLTEGGKIETLRAEARQRQIAKVMERALIYADESTHLPNRGRNFDRAMDELKGLMSEGAYAQFRDSVAAPVYSGNMTRPNVDDLGGITSPSPIDVRVREIFNPMAGPVRAPIHFAYAIGGNDGIPPLKNLQAGLSDLTAPISGVNKLAETGIVDVALDTLPNGSPKDTVQRAFREVFWNGPGGSLELPVLEPWNYGELSSAWKAVFTDLNGKHNTVLGVFRLGIQAAWKVPLFAILSEDSDGSTHTRFVSQETFDDMINGGQDLSGGIKTQPTQ